jgi:hypothetical protein
MGRLLVHGLPRRACVGWCQFGAPGELPRIKHRRAYLDGVSVLPD